MAFSSPLSWLRFVARLIAFVLWLAVLPLLHFALVGLGMKDRYKIPMLFHRGLCAIIGLKVTVKGERSGHSPTLFVSNHISYMDIFVLGHILRGRFIAKKEVEGWPILGPYAKIQNTLFVKRDRRYADEQIKTMRESLLAGDNLILFPEGTSTDGSHVLRFKSTLFDAADCGRPCYVQPVTISYPNYAGKPMSQEMRDYYAWYGTMPFASHLVKALSLKHANVEVVLHEPVLLPEFNDRHHLANHCQQLVEQALHDSLGKPVPEAAYARTEDASVAQ